LLLCPHQKKHDDEKKLVRSKVPLVRERERALDVICVVVVVKHE